MSDILEKDRLLAELDRFGFGGMLHFFDTTESTNDDAMRMLREGARPPFVVAAKRQTRGRGRLDRRWYSDESSTLCVSVAVDLPADAGLVSSFTVACGVEICNALKRAFDAELFLKWPNDLYSKRGGKIGGMLTELYVGVGARSAVFGAGINCFASAGNLSAPSDVLSSMDALESVCSREVSMNALCALVVSSAQKAAGRASTRGLAAEFSPFDWLRGKRMRLDIGGRIIDGIACGIDDSGRIGISENGGRPTYYAAIEAFPVK